MRAGARCVIRDHNGKWLEGEGQNMGYIESVTTEMLVISCGLKLAWRCEARNVVLESDCTEAIDAVEERCVGNRDDRLLIQECKELLARD